MKSLAKKSFPALALVGLLALGGCGQSGYETFEHDNFTLSYPEEWDTLAEHQGLALLIKEPPQRAEEGADGEAPPPDPFTENISVALDIASEVPSLQAYLEGSLERQREQIPRLEMTSQSQATVAGQQAVVLDYTHPHEDITIQGRKIIFLAFEKAYILTYTATPDSFGEYEDIYKTIVDSFEPVQPEE